MFGCKGRAAAGPLALRSPFLCVCVPHLVSCAVVSVCGTAMPGNAAHGDTGWAGTGEPLCSALGCLLISSWMSLAWDSALTDVAGPGAWSEPRPQPCLGSALRQHPRVSSLQGCSWGKKQQMLLLHLFLNCLLFLVRHTRQIHFSQAHQQVSILDGCGGPAQRCRASETHCLWVCFSKNCPVSCLLVYSFPV